MQTHLSDAGGKSCLVTDEARAFVLMFWPSRAAAGRTILDQLSEDSRASVLLLLDKHRDAITVSRTDWAQMNKPG